jgi:hypothetical protein
MPEIKINFIDISYPVIIQAMDEICNRNDSGIARINAIFLDDRK